MMKSSATQEKPSFHLNSNCKRSEWKHATFQKFENQIKEEQMQKEQRKMLTYIHLVRVW